MMTPPMKEYWIDVSGGWFVMGGGPIACENPAHRVFVDPFRLARTPVTQSEYNSFVREAGHDVAQSSASVPSDDSARPAVGLSWHDAVAYCDWVTSVDEPVRLPTEAEWECAALAGREAVLYPWGDEPPESLADYDGRWHDGPESVDLYASTHPLGISGLGLNIHEWCSDWYDADYYRVSPELRPTGPDTGSRRSSRGGSWRHAVKGTRCAARSSIPPDKQYADYGLRLASDAPCES
jgi:formylglycine-generating enzyme required for sulfatase activity